MDYLFFDIEASEGKSICSFGYVLTDENFNILEKKDVLINPEAPFCTQARSKKKQQDEKHKGITLAYPPEVFCSNPNFTKRHAIIKELLEKKDRIIMGFSHVNDARYLRIACTRYSLPHFNYEFFDVQDAYRAYKKIKEQMSLEKIIAELGVNIDGYTLHKSVDDAEISMLVAKGVCKSLNVSLPELIEKFPANRGKNTDGKVIYNGTKADYNYRKKIRTVTRNALYNFAKGLKFNKTNHLFCGKKFCACSTFERDDINFALKAVYELNKVGGKYIGSVMHCDYYVVFDNDITNGRDRQALALDRQKNEPNFKVITEQEFYDRLGCQKEQILQVKAPVIDRTITQLNKTIKEIMQKANEN